MAFLLISLFALGVLLSSSTVMHFFAQRGYQTSEVAPGALEGMQFVRFSLAMEQYVANNPAASGNLPVADASGQYTPTFLSDVSAWVTAPGVFPRMLVCSGKLQSGALQAALRASAGDAALGKPAANGLKWVSVTAPTGGAAQPLPAPVSPGDTIVFVVDVQS